jgi:prepilin-type N-terminal cleavage/methylation domain-containing protein
MMTLLRSDHLQPSQIRPGCTVPNQTPGPEDGLTLMECLVAIVIVAIAGAIIAPAMVLSVATRVQSQRADQALKVAQSQIDNVRVLVERGEATADNLPPTVEATDEKLLHLVDGPVYNSVKTDPANYTDYTHTFPVDGDGDGEDDFAVQTFRTNAAAFDAELFAFGMGVRVYDIDAVNTSGKSGNLSQEPASLTMTSGEGERGSQPLAVVYTTISASEEAQSMCNLFDYIDDTEDKPAVCN